MEVDLIAVGLCEGDWTKDRNFVLLDERLGNILIELCSRGGFEAKENQMISLYTLGKIFPERLLLIGMGRSEEISASMFRTFASIAAKQSNDFAVSKMALAMPSIVSKLPGYGKRTKTAQVNERMAGLEPCIQAIVEGFRLGKYRFDEYKAQKAREKKLKDVRITLYGALPLLRESKILDMSLRKGLVFSDAVIMARNMVNEPSCVMDPDRMVEYARKVSKKKGMSIRVFGRNELKRLNMGLALAVSEGSSKQPRLIHLKYSGKGRKIRRVIAIIGKGITFDSGGLFIKDRKAMEKMKYDMAGGATVISVMSALPELAPDITVHGLVYCTENMLSNSSLRPGDVLHSMSGKTVEVVNTDAEGRLTIADTITYALGQKVDEIVDIATLTGACTVALGTNISGLFSNNDTMAEQLMRAAEVSGERLWRLPLDKKLKESLKSDIADIKNAAGREGGAITAALFLEEFVKDVKWAHIDIAGTAYSDKDTADRTKGATGVGVMTILRYLCAGDEN
jgi:leucyl aminopeptidase